MEKLLVTFLLFFVSGLWNVQGREGEFEPIEKICDRCKCSLHKEFTSSEQDKFLSYSVLDCSTKNLRHMLAEWPEEFAQDLKPGQELVFSLSGNDIHSLQQLPATEADLVFSCRHCNLSELASGLFLDTPNIVRLDLSWNRLSGDVLTPDVFRGPYNDEVYEPLALDELDLSNNLISYLDGSLFEHMAHLRSLSLSKNPLEKITPDTTLALGSIRRLEHLDLSYTGIDELPRGVFDKIDGLKELYLQGNHFKAVPSAIALLKPTLKILNIGDNPIQMLNDESFFDLDRLTHLNISMMENLEDIIIGTFSGLKSLEVLVCSNNPSLMTFDMSDLKGLVRLRQLDLSNCGLQHLHLDEPIPIIDHNSDIAQFEVFQKLRSVNLEGNPWHCDCDLYKTIESFKHILEDEFHGPATSPSNEARCESPYDLAALPLTDLGPLSLCNSPPKKVPKIPIYEAPAFLRPRSIMLSLLSVGIVLLIGFVIGFAIVCIKRRLQKADFGFTSPVRYTTVRDSTTSNILQQQQQQHV
ncbi:carboxypeptidase N subunit 2 isoform X2 [Uranotaenia lowii]|uniref:carboxypeptidase N subunit 2 isoform X2 n=1 Tax=Uranotaenia lowii TaxID=190385 RepID=UPI0024789230|nr:carboxypeptidase N subunit 2 isoform X2 [Uranotaenia lowii]